MNSVLLYWGVQENSYDAVVILSFLKRVRNAVGGR
nr:MAG TPA: hypothetical protein [Caudoviricetes sp.]